MHWMLMLSIAGLKCASDGADAARPGTQPRLDSTLRHSPVLTSSTSMRRIKPVEGGSRNPRGSRVSPFRPSSRKHLHSLQQGVPGFPVSPSPPKNLKCPDGSYIKPGFSNWHDNCLYNGSDEADSPNEGGTLSAQ